MLPRLKALDRLFAAAEQRLIHRFSQQGILSEIKGHLVHEGNRTSIRRPDDTLDETRMVEAEASITAKKEDVESVEINWIVKQLRSLADQFCEQRTKYMFETINEVTRKSGLEHDIKGRPLTHDDIIKVMDSMHIEFSKNKDVGDVTIVTSPQMAKVFERLELERKADPSIDQRWKEMIQRKRDEYRTREADRNLAG